MAARHRRYSLSVSAPGTCLPGRRLVVAAATWSWGFFCSYFYSSSSNIDICGRAGRCTHTLMAHQSMHVFWCVGAHQSAWSHTKTQYLPVITDTVHLTVCYSPTLVDKYVPRRFASGMDPTARMCRFQLARLPPFRRTPQSGRRRRRTENYPLSEHCLRGRLVLMSFVL